MRTPEADSAFKVRACRDLQDRSSARLADYLLRLRADAISRRYPVHEAFNATAGIPSDLNDMISRSSSGVRADVYPVESDRPEKLRALVADDDAGIRVLIHRILTRSGFDVDMVRDGAEAIEHIIQTQYDVIVLDLMMPRIDGFAVMEYLHRNRPDLLSRVLVTTAYGATGLERVRSFVDSCIEKPFEIGALAQKARAIARRIRDEGKEETTPEESPAPKSS